MFNTLNVVVVREVCGCQSVSRWKAGRLFERGESDREWIRCYLIFSFEKRLNNQFNANYSCRILYHPFRNHISFLWNCQIRPLLTIRDQLNFHSLPVEQPTINQPTHPLTTDFFFSNNPVECRHYTFDDFGVQSSVSLILRIPVVGMWVCRGEIKISLGLTQSTMK